MTGLATDLDITRAHILVAEVKCGIAELSRAARMKDIQCDDAIHGLSSNLMQSVDLIRRVMLRMEGKQTYGADPTLGPRPLLYTLPTNVRALEAAE